MSSDQATTYDPPRANHGTNVKPRLLDLFCGGGGAAVGYHAAGFDVIGVDIRPQPNYPYEFIQADAMEYPLDGFDAIHASPPCQAYSKARELGARGRNDHPRLIGPVRRRLEASGRPWVIENVEGAAPHMVYPYILCGSAFGLDVQRHRLFETSFPMIVPACNHGVWRSNRYEGTPRQDGSRPRSRICNPLASGVTHEEFADAMGIDWMPKRGKRPSRDLHEAIPPAYTEFIGAFLMAELITNTNQRGH